MKKLLMIGSIMLSMQLYAQLGEAEQLLIDVQKLAQMRKILENMYDGYQVLFSGYTTIRDIAQGNFSLHKTFLDALLEVSPAVRNYKRVADIIGAQTKIRREYKTAWANFCRSPDFSPPELEYIHKVYQNLMKKTGDNLEDLTHILTAGRLRMNDEERLGAIDRIWKETQLEAAFLKTFTNSTGLLALQRRRETEETRRMKVLQSTSR
jgi:DNA repair ATPase RecN